MSQNRLSVSVVVAEPELNYQSRLVEMCERIWDSTEVLPRSSGAELLNALKWLDCKLIVVRASIMQANVAYRNSVIDLVSRGAYLVCIQDTDYPFSMVGSTILNRMYFVSSNASSKVLSRALLQCRIAMLGDLEPTPGSALFNKLV